MKATKCFVGKFVEEWSNVLDMRVVFDVGIVVKSSIFNVDKKTLETLVGFGV